MLLVAVLIPATTTDAARKSKDRAVDWSRPETIDPLREGISDFLEVDLGPYRAEALRAFRERRYEDAARNWLFLLRHRHDDVESLYNLACAYARLGKPEQAADNMVRAVLAGMRDFEHIRTDEDLAGVRQDEYFRERMAAIERLEASLGQAIYVEATKLVKCRIKLPPAYDPDREYPLLIGLHGNGGNADDFIRLWQAFDKQDFIFAAAQGAYPRSDAVADANGHYSWGIQSLDHGLWSRADPLGVEQIRSLVDAIADRFRVGKVYLMGFSQGAAFTYMAGIRHPERFAGIICIGGRLPETGKSYSVLTEEDIENGKELPVLIAHSREDGAISFGHSVRAKKRLKRYGYQVTFHEYEGGHVLTTSILNRVAQWMRRDRPKRKGAAP
jgi:phospholipase/carboxylesterase